MTKRIVAITAMVICATFLFAQTPYQFKYQALLRNADGTPIATQSISVNISILQGDAETGSIVFSETHNTQTSSTGLINLNIGSMNDLSSIDWSSDNYHVQISVDGTIMGTSQLLSVPYALHAETVTDADDADADPTNEIQSLSLSNNQLSISEGNAINLPYDSLPKGKAGEVLFNNGEQWKASSIISGDKNSNLIEIRNSSNLPGASTLKGFASTSFTAGYLGVKGSDNFESTGLNLSNANIGVLGMSNISSQDGYGVLGYGHLYGGYFKNHNGNFTALGGTKYALEVEGDISMGKGEVYVADTLRIKGGLDIGRHAMAVNISDIIELTGTLESSGGGVILDLPSGFDESNTRILTIEIKVNHFWSGNNLLIQNPTTSTVTPVWYQLVDNQIYLTYPNNSAYHDKDYRIIIMRVN